MLLSPESVLSIFACLCLAVLMQSLSGFGFGLIVVACFTLFDLMPLTSTTLFVSVLGFINSAGIVMRNRAYVDWRRARLILLTGIPFMVVGFSLLEYMSQSLSILLNIILGICILACCVLMVLKNTVVEHSSKPQSFLIAGGLGGLLGGLFSTFGPPVVFACYRQPWSIQKIRATLLAVFTATAVFRISLAFFGTLPEKEIGLLMLFSVPLVIMMTAVGHKLAKWTNPSIIRPLAATLLSLSGFSILISNLLKW